MDKRLLYYEALGTFKNLYFKDLLTHEHLVNKQIHIKKLIFPDGYEDDTVNFWGYQLVKDGNTYLVSSTDENSTEIDIRKILPIMPRDVMKVATSSGEVYHWIRNPMSVKFKEEKYHNPKEFIDTLSMLEHSNPTHHKLMWMMALSQLWDRSYYRVASNPGNGKDSVVDICNSLFGNCGTIESPTIAKLEDRATVLKWLAVNEVVDIVKGDWDIIQQFLLAMGAHKNEVTKHSRAFQNVKEIIDTRNFSISLYYNDINCYPDMNKYFDFVTKHAVMDRFPAFRLYGKYTQDFNALHGIDVNRLVEDNMDFYKNLLKTYTYYNKTFNTYLKGFNYNKLMQVDGRMKINLGRLLKVVDFYSDSQEEFDGWVQLINNSLLDYQEMLSYKPVAERFVETHGQETYKDVKKSIDKLNTFKEKINYLKEYNRGTVQSDNKTLQNWENEIL